MQSCLHAASLLREISEEKKNLWPSLSFDPFATHKSGDFHEVALFARTECTRIAHKRFIETVKMLLRLVFRSTESVVVASGFHRLLCLVLKFMALQLI